jgi:Transposase
MASERRAGGLSIIQAAYDSALRLRSASRRNPICLPSSTEARTRGVLSKIQGCDFHSRFQQIAMVDTETGELIERRLEHRNAEAKKFYAELQKPVHVGMEATGYAQWFERMLTRLGHELWVGDVGEIRAAMVRKQKTDSRDVLHILDLMLQGRFPRVWIPSPAASGNLFDKPEFAPNPRHVFSCDACLIR